MARPLHLIHNLGNAARSEDAAERAILEAVEAMDATLRNSGWDVRRTALVPPYSGAFSALEQLEPDIVVFNLFEGFPDDQESEVQVRLLLDRLGFRVTGCPALAMHIGLHKAIAKQVLHGAGIPVPGGLVARRPADLEGELPAPFPLFLKPAADDASHGIGPESVVRDRGALLRQGRLMLGRHPGGVLVEPYLEGREFNCGVVDGPDGLEALPPSLVDYSRMPEGHPPILTFEAKWAPGSEVYLKSPTVCPAPVEPATVRRVQALALASARAVGIRGYGRVDLREDGVGNLLVLEVNPNPDISPDAGLAKQARARGWDYAALLERVLEAAQRPGASWS